MPYRRKYPRARTSKRRSYAARRPRRSYAVKRRSYGRKPRTQKAILNLTSRKKCDTMLNSTNISAATPSGSSTFTTGPAVLNADNIYVLPWIATARPALINGILAAPLDLATRTSSTCFMRGLKETITISTNSGAPWMWRRICFKFKGDDLNAYVDHNFTWWRATSTQGVVRNLTSAYASPSALAALKLWIFEGSEGFDWVDMFNAKTDPKRISVCYDKCRTFNAGNASGVIRNMRMWHPMNKNLTYNDDESAQEQVTQPYSVTSKDGMGDFYVVDFFRGIGTATDLLSLSIEAKLYWHEK